MTSPGLPSLPAPARAGTPAPRRAVRRWAALGLALLVLAGALGLVGMRLGLGIEAAKRDLVAALSQGVRGAVRIEGPVSLSLLPKTRLIADEVWLEPGDGGTVAVRRLVAELDPVKALFGSAAIEHLRLDTPRFEPPAGAGPALLDRPLEGLEAAAAALTVLDDVGEIEILNGSLPAGRGGIAQADLTLSGGRFSTAADIEGSFLWNGERTSLEASIERAHDGAVILEGRLESAALTASLTGRTLAGPDLRFEGAVSLAAPSLKRVAAWVGHAGPPFPEVGPVSLDASLRLDAASASLPDAKLLLAGSRGHGALVLVRDGPAGVPGRPRLDGSLAFADLDLRTLVGALAPPPAGPAGLDRPIAVGFLGLADLDLRVSAQDADLGPAPVSDIAATLHLERGVATLDLGDAALLGGRARARLVLDSTRAVPRITGSFGLREADLADLGQALDIPAPSFAGKAALDGTLDAPLSSWADLASRSRMEARLNGRNGTLDLAALPAADAAAPPLLAPGLAALPYSTLSADLVLSGPRAILKDMVLDAPGGRLELGGTIAETGDLGLRGRFDPAASVDASGAGIWAPDGPRRVEITGAWPAPQVALGPLAASAPAP